MHWSTLAAFVLAASLFVAPVGAETIHLEAEDYKVGGQGVGYNDTNSSNEGGDYRDDGVDIQDTSDTVSDYNVGWTEPGEWLILTTDPGTWETDPVFPVTESYFVTFRVAVNDDDGAQVHLEIDGADVTGTVNLPDTGGWQDWTDVTVQTTPITAGSHEVKFVADSSGFNFNWIELTPVPEPASLSILAAGGFALLRRRRR